MTALRWTSLRGAAALQGVASATNAKFPHEVGGFEWILRSVGASSEGRLFAYLHDGHCQPKKKKCMDKTLNFGSINFQLKARLQVYVPTPVACNRWETDWVHRWFYHSSPVDDLLHSRGGLIQLTGTLEIALTSKEEALLHVLLDVTKRLSTRDLVEEFCAFHIWPLARGWQVEFWAAKFGLPTLTVLGRDGTVCEGTIFFGFVGSCCTPSLLAFLLIAY